MNLNQGEDVSANILPEED